MIYFAQLATGPIKIGTSENVPKRIVQLEGYYKQDVTLLATMPGGRKEEREIHERFDHLRFGNTEQFQPAADLLQFIGRPLLASPNPDAVCCVEVDNSMITMVCCGPYKAWVDRFAKDQCVTPSQLITIALKVYAELEGHELPPPRTAGRSR